MPGPGWIGRCLPGLSVLAVLILVEYALGIVRTLYLRIRFPDDVVAVNNHWLAQNIFVFYSLFLHALALVFPLRLSLAAWKAARAIEDAHAPRQITSVTDRASSHDDDRISMLSKSDFDDDFDSLDPDVDIVHAIILPSYKEEIHVLEDTLKVLASHGLAKRCYDVFLAMEERDPNGVGVATKLIGAFQHGFRDMQFTEHPAGIVGEVPGKSSNISWAAGKVAEKYASTAVWEDVLLTVMDSDTHFLSTYFKIVTQRHNINRQGGNVLDMTMYIPPIIFDRNAHHVPIFVRSADMMWSSAGLSCFEARPKQGSIAIPTSAYTVTLPLVQLTGGWDTGPQAIGEDMHMMLKCYFHTQGRLNTESVPSPASHCNISSSMTGIRGWFDGHRARYLQGLRHMWGCLDTGYTVYNLRRSPVNPNSKSPSLRATPFRHHLLKLANHRLGKGDRLRLACRHMTLCHRIFEAHFLPVHLLIMAISSGIFTSLTAPVVRTHSMNFMLDTTGWLRASSFLVMVSYFCVCYERHHRACVSARIDELKRVGLLDEMQDSINVRESHKPRTWIDYFAFPIAGAVFGGAPLFHAAFAHFWTARLDYKVSLKPKKLILSFDGVRAEEGRADE